MENNNAVPIKSLKKALDILDYLLFHDSAGRGFELSTLAEHFQLPANSVHHLLKTMCICGYVEKNASGRYTSGPNCRRIAYRNYQAGDVFRERLLETIRSCVRDLGESMVFSVLNNFAWTPIVRCEPSGRVVKVDMEMTERCYLFEAATGRVLYAFSTPDMRKKLLRINGDPGESWPDYEKDVRKIRREGRAYAYRIRYGTASFAVPVFDREEHLIGSLGLHSIRLDWRENEKNAFFDRMLAAAEEIRGF